jgi:hypothetical protein
VADDLQEAVQRLVDLEAIKVLKARYLRLLDTKQWQELPALFTEDAIVTLGSGRELRGAQGIVDSLAKGLAEKQSEHHGHMPEIAFMGPDKASGIWALYEYQLLPEAANEPPKVAFGYYHDEYERAGEDWKISSMRVVRRSPTH